MLKVMKFIRFNLQIMKKNEDRIVKIDASEEIELISKKILSITLEKINEAI